MRDLLLTAVEIQAIQSSLRVRMPGTAQHVINRIASKWRDRPKTEGKFTSAQLVHRNSNQYSDPEQMYTLNQKYRGGAHREVETYGRRKHLPKGRRLKINWIRDLKDSFVCARDHIENLKHKREEVLATIKRLKEKQATALLRVTDIDKCTGWEQVTTRR